MRNLAILFLLLVIVTITQAAEHCPEHANIVTPQMFGAKVNDGKDDSKAIQDAVNACIGRCITFPGGTYNTSDPIELPSHSCLQGDGLGTYSTALNKFTPAITKVISTATPVFENIPGTSTHGLYIKGFKLEALGGHAFEFNAGVSHSRFENLSFLLAQSASAFRVTDSFIENYISYFNIGMNKSANVPVIDWNGTVINHNIIEHGRITCAGAQVDYPIHIEGSDLSSGNNVLSNIVGEICLGGFVELRGMAGGKLDTVNNLDTLSTTFPTFVIGTSTTGGGASRRIVIENVVSVVGNATKPDLVVEPGNYHIVLLNSTLGWLRGRVSAVNSTIENIDSFATGFFLNLGDRVISAESSGGINPTLQWGFPGYWQNWFWIDYKGFKNFEVHGHKIGFSNGQANIDETANLHARSFSSKVGSEPVVSQESVNLRNDDGTLAGIWHISGENVINNIDIVGFYRTGTCVTLIPDGEWSTSQSGNIGSPPITASVNISVNACYDGTKWYLR